MVKIWALDCPTDFEILPYVYPKFSVRFACKATDSFDVLRPNKFLVPDVFKLNSNSQSNEIAGNYKLFPGACLRNGWQSGWLTVTSIFIDVLWF